MDWTLLIWTGAGLVGLTFLAAIWITIVESDRVYEWRRRRQLRQAKVGSRRLRKFQAEMLADQNKGLKVK